MNLCVFIMIVSMFVSGCSYADGQAPTFDESALKDYAENEGYGYKTGNLRELKKLVDSFNQGKQPLQVQVPDFVGISSVKVVEALGKAGFDVQAKWSEVVMNLGDRESILQDKQFPDEFWKAEEAFLDELEEAWSKLDQENPFDIDDDQMQMLTTLFDSAGKASDKLMVRSTGKEDTRTMANAGGNESIANVEPGMSDVLDAAKVVVASYFGEKSLCQRLGLGDESLFSKDVFCPILVQRMIGEHKGGEIPSCGVMFTEEAEGGISYKDEKDENGRIKTTGITMIQASYGHNEGVVNSKVVVDTYVAQNVLGKPVFYPIIRKKSERLVPSEGEGGLVVEQNSDDKALASALSGDALTTLKKFADALEVYYGYPMDVEYVVRDSAIWIVQARPIVHKEERKTRKPGYIADLKDVAGGTVFKGRTIGAFGGAIVEVASAEECIISNKIGAALDEYLKGSRDAIKCVLSGTDAPATSHEATTFRSEGKPVLYVQDLDGMRKAFGEGKKIVFSPQQHCVVVVDESKTIALKDGWCAYPLPRELSVDTLLFANKGIISKGSVSDKVKGMEVAQLFEKLRGEDNDLAMQAASVLSDALANALAKQLKSVTRDKDIDAQSKLITEGAKILCDRIAWLCKRKVSLLERLLPVNYLEALVYQQVSGDRQLKYLSVATLGKAFKEEKASTVSTVSFGSDTARGLYAQLKKASQYCFTDEATQAWMSLVAGLAREADGQGIQSLADFVVMLTAFDVLPLWLNSMMVNDVKSNLNDVVNLIEKWVESIRALGGMFEKIQELKKRVDNFVINRFADPKTFNGAWKDFEILRSEFMNKDFVDGFHNVPEARYMVEASKLNVMIKFVDVFDTSIKAMKGSSLWQKSDKPKVFKMMLQAYYELLKNWVGLIPDVSNRLSFNRDTALQSYYDMIERLVYKKYTETDLEGSINFDAIVFSMGSGHNWVGDSRSNKQPETGEDVYTIIHQSLINVCSALSLSCGVNKILLPKIIEEISVSLDGVMPYVFPRKKNMTGVCVDYGEIVVGYNMPLASHSLQTRVSVASSTGAVMIEMDFFGGTEREIYRWINAAALVTMYSAYGSFEVQIKKIHAHSLSLLIFGKIKFKELEAFLSTLASVIGVGATGDMPRLQLAIDEKKVCEKIIVLNRLSGRLKHPVVMAYCRASLDIMINNKELIEKDKVIEEAVTVVIAVASEAVKSVNKDILSQGFFILKKLVPLVARYDASNELVALAVKLVKSDQHDVKLQGLDLLSELVKKNKGFDGAKVAVVEVMNSLEKDICLQGLSLATELIKKKQGFDEAIKIAAKFVSSSNDEVFFDSLILFSRLISKGQGFYEAATAAAVAVEKPDTDNTILETALEIFEKLVKQDQQVLVIQTLEKMPKKNRLKCEGLSELFEKLKK